MSDEWYYGCDGEQHGPVTVDELRRLAASGEIVPTDLVWKDGMDEWIPASKVRGLFAIKPSPLPRREPLPSPDEDDPPRRMKPSPPKERKSSAAMLVLLVGSVLVAIIGIGVVFRGTRTQERELERSRQLEQQARGADTPRLPSDLGTRRLNKSNYDKIKVGMSLAEVERILGKGEEQSSGEGFLTMVWKDDDKMILITFSDGTVGAKVQHGL